MELGPVYANFFGDTLFENPYSWNFVSFLESLDFVRLLYLEG